VESAFELLEKKMMEVQGQRQEKLSYPTEYFLKPATKTEPSMIDRA